MFNRHINPYLDRPYAGEALSEFLIEQMPAARRESGLSLTRQLKQEGHFLDPVRVTDGCKEIITAFAKAPSSAPPVANLTKELKSALQTQDAGAALAALEGQPLNKSMIAALAKHLKSKAPPGSNATAERRGRLHMSRLSKKPSIH